MSDAVFLAIVFGALGTHVFISMGVGRFAVRVGWAADSFYAAAMWFAFPILVLYVLARGVIRAADVAADAHLARRARLESARIAAAKAALEAGRIRDERRALAAETVKHAQGNGR